MCLLFRKLKPMRGCANANEYTEDWCLATINIVYYCDYIQSILVACRLKYICSFAGGLSVSCADTAKHSRQRLSTPPEMAAKSKKEEKSALDMINRDPNSLNESLAVRLLCWKLFYCRMINIFFGKQQPTVLCFGKFNENFLSGLKCICIRSQQISKSVSKMRCIDKIAIAVRLTEVVL